MYMYVIIHDSKSSPRVQCFRVKGGFCLFSRGENYTYLRYLHDAKESVRSGNISCISHSSSHLLLIFFRVGTVDSHQPTWTKHVPRVCLLQAPSQLDRHPASGWGTPVDPMHVQIFLWDGAYLFDLDVCASAGILIGPGTTFFCFRLGLTTSFVLHFPVFSSSNLMGVMMIRGWIHVDTCSYVNYTR